MRTPTRWERSDTRRPVACLAAAGDAGEGRCQDPVPSWPARPFAVARSPDGGGQGGAFDAVQARRHGLPARGRHGRDGDGRRRPAAERHDPERRRDGAGQRRAAGVRPGGGSPSAPAGEINLFDTAYEPASGSDGGQAIIGDWQEATQFNPYYFTQVTEGNVASATWATLATFTDDYKYAPDLAKEIPTLDNGGVKVPGDGGDAMTVTWNLRDNLKWSDGQDLTCDDFKYAWEWVHRSRQRRRRHVGLRRRDGVGLPVAHGDGPPLQERVRGLHHDGGGPAAAPLPVGHPDQGAGRRPRLPAQRDRKHAHERRVQVRVGHARRRAPARQEPQLHELEDGPADAPRHPGVQVVRRPRRDDRGLSERRGRHRDRPPGLGHPEGPGPGRRGELDPVADLRIPAPQLVGHRRRRRHQGRRRLLQEPRGPRSRQRLPDGRPGDARGARVRRRQERDQRPPAGRPGPGREHVRQPQRLVLRRPDTGHFDPAKAKQILEDAGWTDADGDGIREKNGLRAKIELCTTTRQVRQDTLALIAGWLKDIGIDTVINPVDATSIFADYNESTADTPCVLSHGNFDLAEHATPRRSTRWATTSATTAASSTRLA